MHDDDLVDRESNAIAIARGPQDTVPCHLA
jgi:hypothetical protein